MLDHEEIEQHYQEYAKDLAKWIPEGVTEVDLALLHRLQLLHYHSIDVSDPGLTRYFQVIESYEKITLINEQFVVWVVPDVYEQHPVTYTLIALRSGDHLHMELAFLTSGVYNNSRLVLRVLEKFLWEIQENQELLNKLETSSSA